METQLENFLLGEFDLFGLLSLQSLQSQLRSPDAGSCPHLCPSLCWQRYQEPKPPSCITKHCKLLRCWLVASGTNPGSLASLTHSSQARSRIPPYLFDNRNHQEAADSSRRVQTLLWGLQRTHALQPVHRNLLVLWKSTSNSTNCHCFSWLLHFDTWIRSNCFPNSFYLYFFLCKSLDFPLFSLETISLWVEPGTAFPRTSCDPNPTKISTTAVTAAYLSQHWQPWLWTNPEHVRATETRFVLFCIHLSVQTNNTGVTPALHLYLTTEHLVWGISAHLTLIKKVKIKCFKISELHFFYTFHYGKKKRETFEPCFNLGG